jgi:hypothetical protein
MTKIIVSLFLILVSSFAQASGFTVFDNIDACKIAVSAGKAQSYTPTTKAPFQGGKGWTKKVVGAGGACLGQAHVLEDGAPKNGKSVYVPAEFVYWEHISGSLRMHICSNPFGSLAQLTPVVSTGTSQPEAPAVLEHGSCTTNNCNTVTEVQVVNQVVVRNGVCKDEVNNTTFAPTNGQCNFNTIQANVSVSANSSTVCLNCTSGASIKPVSTTPAAQTSAPCTTCGEKVTVTREEKRTDGRCFVQTNMGYKFEVRANASNGRLMASLVNPQNNNPIDGTRSLYVGNVQASKKSQGFDCDGMQQQLTNNWEAVRSAYGIPSVCQIAKKD